LNSSEVGNAIKTLTAGALMGFTGSTAETESSMNKQCTNKNRFQLTQTTKTSMRCQRSLLNSAENDLINKRKLFLDLLLDEYKSESLRATEIDNKAFRSLSASAFFFAVMALSVNFASSDMQSFFLRDNFIRCLLLPLFLVSSIATWVVACRSFSLISFGKLSLSNDDCSSIEKKSLPDIYAGFCAKYSDVNAQLDEALKKKACLLKYAQGLLLTSGILAFLMAGYALFKYSRF
jgi:hypothetical protein